MLHSLPPKVIRVRLVGLEQAVRKYFSAYPLEAQSVHFTEGGVMLDVFVSERQYAELAGYGLRVVQAFDATVRGEQRRREVGLGDRFRGGRLPPGLGIKI